MNGGFSESSVRVKPDGAFCLRRWLDVLLERLYERLFSPVRMELILVVPKSTLLPSNLRKGKIMRRLHICLIITVAFGFQFQKEAGRKPQINTNLITNGSFEVRNAPTLRGWRRGNPELARLVRDVPPKGGNWSLELTADWAPTSGFVSTFVKNIKPGEVLKLTAFVRAVGSSGGGVIELKIGSSPPKSVSTTDTLWTKLSVIDTAHVEKADTAWITLSSFHTELLPRKGLFDLVRLERVRR